MDPTTFSPWDFMVTQPKPYLPGQAHQSSTQGRQTIRNSISGAFPVHMEPSLIWEPWSIRAKLLEWIAGFNADSDGDGAPNGLESALGRDPFVFEPEAILKLDGNRGNLSLVFPKPSLFYSNFVSTQVHQSNSLTDSFEELFSNRTRPFEASGENIIIPLQPNGARFFRLEATLK
ncbi:MAG: hypothetical protein ABF379_05885 [Akkermansiaceae bacterium]